MTYNEKPPVLTDRGRKIYAVPPLVQYALTDIPSRCLATPLAVSGDPVLPYCHFRQATPGGISASFPHCLAPPGSSLAEKKTLTCSHHCVYCNILTKRLAFVKGFPAFSGPILNISIRK